MSMSYVGSGGYGQVFKIKIQTELVLKIIRPVGKVCDYKEEASALEREYRLVTSLGNHRRIIQLFGFVTDVKSMRLIIIMEYLEGGSLADKLKSENPLPIESVLKYLTQILEGVVFLHRREIYHSDVNPANILFTLEDNLKISDLGISARSQLQTNSSHFQGDFHYLSPERLLVADRSAANDIWSVGATFVHMISGQPLNHFDTTIPLLSMNISQYKIFVKGAPLNNYLQTLNDSDCKKKVISRTLCNKPNRANGQQLLRILFSHSKRLPAEALMAAGDKNPDISGMSYNSARDELFLADFENKVLRAMRVSDNAGDLRDLYRGPRDKPAHVC